MMTSWLPTFVDLVSCVRLLWRQNIREKQRISQKWIQCITYENLFWKTYSILHHLLKINVKLTPKRLNKIGGNFLFSTQSCLHQMQVHIHIHVKNVMFYNFCKNITLQILIESAFKTGWSYPWKPFCIMNLHFRFGDFSHAIYEIINGLTHENK